MSDLTKRLRESYISTGQNYVQEAADRIDALEECLREFLAWADAPIGPHEQLAKVIDKARALLEAND